MCRRRWPAGRRAMSDAQHRARSFRGSYAVRTLERLRAAISAGEEDGVTPICNEAYIAAPTTPNDPDGAQMAGSRHAAAPDRRRRRGVLELFHGPSLSFKDVAMQLIGPLFDRALTRRDQRLSVDLRDVRRYGRRCGGSAEGPGAHRSVRADAEGPRLRGAAPVHDGLGRGERARIEVDGDFDACQAMVKALFADDDFARRAQLSGVNSINWARIVAQSVYFQIAAHILSAHGPVELHRADRKFRRRIFRLGRQAAWARRSASIVLATNDNDILVRALQTGRYQRARTRRRRFRRRWTFRSPPISSASCSKRWIATASTCAGFMSNSRNRAASTFPMRRWRTCAMISLPSISRATKKLVQWIAIDAADGGYVALPAHGGGNGCAVETGHTSERAGRHPRDCASREIPGNR